MTWTHNGEPLGPKPRPWRLTRRQRVEMEAALARLRRSDPDTLTISVRWKADATR